MKCPRCQQDNPSHAKFCLECGAPVDGSALTPKSYADLAGELERLRGSLGEAQEREAEAREQQLATSEILGVLSSSPTAVQPVFDTIVENAVRLCDGLFSALCSFDGELIHAVAMHNYNAEALGVVRRVYPLRPTRGMLVGRAILERTVVHVPDVEVDPEYQHRELSHSIGFRSALAIPMMRDGAPIGAILVARADAGPFSDSEIALLNTFADQAVIAIENVRLFTELQDKNRALTAAHAQVTESLEQQVATGEILRVISSSPTDVRPVFSAVARSAARLCEAQYAGVALVEDGNLVIPDLDDYGVPSEQEQFLRRLGRIPISPDLAVGRAVIEGTVQHIEDVLADGSPRHVAQEIQRALGLRTFLAVPMRREGSTIGVIVAWRTEPRPFTTTQIELLKTFADQAVIAIENVRLFNETKEALDQQIATAEILGVISRSPTDIQPVLDAVAESAARLCGSLDGVILRRENDQLVLCAHYGPISVGPTGEFSLPLGRDSASGRAVLDGRTVHVADMQAEKEEFLAGSEHARTMGHRTILHVPLMRDGVAIGTIGVRRTEARRFTDRQVALLQTFADQAVIAIENVRLFTELQEKNQALTQAHAQVSESLEQQTATSEILRVISSSPTDVQPVFDAIVESAARLCNAPFSTLATFDGELIDLVAAHNWTPAAFEVARRLLSDRHPSRATGSGRAILDRTVVHVPDTERDPEYELQELTRVVGSRSGVFVPMLRDGAPVGVIAVGRAEPGPFSDNQIALLKTFADQAVIAIENVRLFNETKEALERQTATADILRVISSSPTDAQPVFEAIAESAVRLMEAVAASVYEFDGTLLHLRTLTPASWPHADELRRRYPRPPDVDLAAGRVILERAILHLADLQTDPATPSVTRQIAERMGLKAVVWVPMMRDGAPIGVIGVVRATAGLFSDKQVRLLQTFADQAVIAIENVRLFNETKEALEQQTATSEILRVISSSPTDIQPVLDVVAASAARVCGAADAVILRVEGQETRRVAHSGAIPLILPEMRRITPASPGGRAILECRSIHVHDAFDADFAHDYPETAAVVRDAGWRTILVVPLIRKNVAIGIISIRRTDVRPFTEKQVALLETFADQAVIAIENVRLFKELEEKNRSLTEALEQQTATSEILSVISGSPTDTQPVFEAIAESVVRLCDGLLSTVFRFDGTLLHFVAHHGVGPVGLESLQRVYPMPPNRSAAAARAVLDCRPIHIPDVLEDSDVRLQELAGAVSWRSCLSVPMLREGKAIGAIAVARTHAGPFSDSQIELLKTFADQAVIAIENVRLFTELQGRNRDLTTALDQQTATSEILRVISSSPTDVQPVFDAIVRSAERLCSGQFSVLFLFDGELVHFVAHHNLGPEALDEAKRIWPTRPVRASGTGRAILERRVIQIADIETDPEYGLQRLSRAVGHRSSIYVPMLRDGLPVGVIVVARVAPGHFADNQVALLQTFADQAVIAIENVRLFKELEARNGDLVAASEILQVISRSPTNVQPVFEAIAESAARLTNALYGGTFLVADNQLYLAAIHLPGGANHELFARAYPIPLDDRTLATRIARDGVIGNIADIETDLSLPEPQRQRARMLGARALLIVPMLRDGRTVGMVIAARGEAGAFTDQQVALLQTFSNQAVIAIENVRLFNELQTSNRDLTAALDTQTATSDILRVISRSQTDVQPVFDAILTSAVRLLRGYSSILTRVAGDQIVLAALTRTNDAGDAAVRAFFPQTLQSSLLHAEAIRTRKPLNIADTDIDPRMSEGERAMAQVRGNRSWIVVPMLHHDDAIGTIVVTRREPGGFTDDEIALLQTFADQAVIAIENARLLSELQARTGELTRSVGELRALGEVGQALSSTLDVDVVLDTIVTRANDLIGADGCTIFEYDEDTEQFHLRATRNLEPRLVELARGTPLRKGDQGILGQLPVGRRAVQVPDIIAGSYSSPISEALIEAGYRAVVAVPLIREDHLIGALTMNRKTPGEFPAETIELLQTFATQSALAIQNARLFREIEEKSRQLEVASQHKSEFLANMSHELRTPLNAVIGFSEVLSERMFGDLNEKQDEYLKDIHASGQHLLSLINDILDLSKIEAGRMELEVTDFDLPMAIDNAMTLIRERAARRSIALHAAVDERLGQIQGDERKIRQILLNLLSNAIKFTPEGGRIEVGAKPVNGSIEVSVSDTGVGIAPEDQEAVFEEFKQVGTAEKKVEGTGLGLALSRKFIELHRGKIWVKSQVGLGSTFTFTVPVRRGE